MRTIINTRWALYGVRYERRQTKIGGKFESETIKELIALFSTKQKAKQYIKKSQLKNLKPYNVGESGKIYKDKSLLKYYEEADIEEYFKPDYPIDPEIE